MYADHSYQTADVEQGAVSARVDRSGQAASLQWVQEVQTQPVSCQRGQGLPGSGEDHSPRQLRLMAIGASRSG